MNKSPSELFYEKTNREYVFSIQPIVNIHSIIEHGLLSYKNAHNLLHQSVALEEVQHRRDIKVVDGLSLHDYVCLYFDFWNPMLSRLRSRNNEICILAVHRRVLDFSGALYTDCNAASDYSRFFRAQSGFDFLDTDGIYRRDWRSNDYFEYSRMKSIKCAEVLISNNVSYEYIIGAIVYNEDIFKFLRSNGFSKDIIVNRECFF